MISLTTWVRPNCLGWTKAVWDGTCQFGCSHASFGLDQGSLGGAMPLLVGTNLVILFQYPI